MIVLVLYDIATTDRIGKKRLCRVEKCCGRVGVPVQYSAYECELNWEQYQKLRKELEEIIDPQADGVRFYCLGRQSNRIEQLGMARTAWDRETFVL